LKSARNRVDMTIAYREVGTYRGAAAMCGCDPKTIKPALERIAAGDTPVARPEPEHNYDLVREIVKTRVDKTAGKISAKRLLPEARTAGYTGSARNFRRLVAKARSDWRRSRRRGRRPAVWSPGETLVIDWGSVGTLHVFCAVLAWSRWRFVRFAADEKATTPMAMLAECFEELGGVPMVVADRMACLRAGFVANSVVPTPDYVRFATHHRCPPDLCEGCDPESKGIVENLVGYAKNDLIVPAGLDVADPDVANVAARAWCAEVNARVHSEICAVPTERLVTERDLLGALPSLRPPIGRAVMRKVDRLNCVRIGSDRYSVPVRLIGHDVEVIVSGRPGQGVRRRRDRRRPRARGHRRNVGARRPPRRRPAGPAAAGPPGPDRGGEGLLGLRAGSRGVLEGRGGGRGEPTRGRAR